MTEKQGPTPVPPATKTRSQWRGPSGARPGSDSKLLFSLQGVDLHDDDALDAFARRVWEHATNEWGNTMSTTSGPSTVLTAKYTEAVAYATALHGISVRKGTKTTYMCHLLGVSSLVLEAGGTEDEAIAGLLHDAVEDAGGLPRLADIRIRFGCTVADIVEACSDSFDEEWKKRVGYVERKQAYLDHLEDPETDSRAVLVSIADKVHNARATVTDLERSGVTVPDKFNAPNRGLILWYYEELLRIALARGVTDVLTIPLGIATATIKAYESQGEQASSS